MGSVGGDTGGFVDRQPMFIVIEEDHIYKLVIL
jgi:hypothetical protein